MTQACCLNELVPAAGVEDRAADLAADLLRFLPLVRRICARLLPRSEVDDAVQEVLLRALRQPAGRVDPGRTAGYLSAIARNHCTDRRRGRGRNVSLDELEHEPGERTVDGPGERVEELVERLTGMIDRLPPNQHRALRLYYFERMSYAEVAERLGTTEAAVNQRLSRARQALRAGLAAHTARAS